MTTSVADKPVDKSNPPKVPEPSQSTPSESPYERPLASSPLIVSLLVVLLAAVLVQGALLIGLYINGKPGEKTAADSVAQPATPDLVAKTDDADTASSSPNSNSTSQSHSPLKTSPLGSLLTDDFFSDDWQPFAEMARMREQMDSLFEDSFSRFRSMPGFDEQWLSTGATLSGDAAVTEEDGNFVVTMDLPGADEATLNIELEDNVLSVSGQREEIKEERNDQDAVIRQSRSTSSFQRSFSLPGDVNAADMKSDYKNGVLTITVPKSNN